jgi:hypothetical protein
MSPISTLILSPETILSLISTPTIHFEFLHLLTFQTPILDVVFTTSLFTYFSKELKL